MCRKYQNKNKQSVVYGKWFARAVTIGKTIDLDELAKHMSEHNTPYSKGAIKGVLTDMIGCVRELMLEGKAVKLEGLAIFSAGIKTKKSGALTWKAVIQVVISILTAALTALGTTSCMGHGPF